MITLKSLSIFQKKEYFWEQNLVEITIDQGDKYISNITYNNKISNHYKTKIDEYIIRNRKISTPIVRDLENQKILSMARQN